MINKGSVVINEASDVINKVSVVINEESVRTIVTSFAIIEVSNRIRLLPDFIYELIFDTISRISFVHVHLKSACV